MWGKIILTGLAVAGTLTLCTVKQRTALPEPSISRVVTGVDGFELIHTGFTAHTRPNFGAGYAIWANYPSFVHAGQLYRREGAGGVIIMPEPRSAPRYRVEEIASKTGALYGEVTSRLLITDTATGEVLGSRYLRPRQVENGHGWHGQHAAEFVRAVLRSDSPVGGAVGVKPYPKLPFTLEELPLEPRVVPKDGGDGCPGSYHLRYIGGHQGVDTGAWTYTSQNHANGFACHGETIVVLSGYGAQVFLDVLRADGVHLFQSELAAPVSLRANARPDRVAVDGNGIVLDLVFYDYVKGDDGPQWLPSRRFRTRVNTALPGASTRSAALAVK